jgi:hypothetical protein
MDLGQHELNIRPTSDGYWYRITGGGYQTNKRWTFEVGIWKSYIEQAVIGQHELNIKVNNGWRSDSWS